MRAPVNHVRARRTGMRLCPLSSSTILQVELKSPSVHHCEPTPRPTDATASSALPEECSRPEPRNRGEEGVRPTTHLIYDNANHLSISSFKWFPKLTKDYGFYILEKWSTRGPLTRVGKEIKWHRI